MKKAERLLDLITFLLNARQPVSFEQIQNEFPEDYADGSEEAIARKFERDKADILDAGLPLKFVQDEEEDLAGYVIDRDSYALPSISLGPEELAVLYMAGSAVLDMGASPFSHDLVMALNKIGFAAGDARGGSASIRSLPANRMEQPAALRRKDYLESLRRAIAGRKSVILFYHSLWSDDKTRRTVDPYGLACTRGTWFLVGYCHLREAIRVFHVDRITGLEVNRFKPRSPDFAFPQGFRLDGYVSKHPWQLKLHEPREAVLRIESPAAEVFVTEAEIPPDRVERTDQALIVRLQTTFLQGLLPTILWHRDKLQVLEPPELVASTRAALQRLVEAVS